MPLRNGKEQRQRLVHRLAAEAFLGPQPSADHVVVHLDGDRQNNRAENLAWAKRKRVSDEKVSTAMRLWKSEGLSLRTIARRVGFPYGTLARHMAARNRKGD